MCVGYKHHYMWMSYLKTTKSLAGWGAMLFWTYWYISVWLSKGSITLDSMRSSSQRCCSLSKRFKTSSGVAEISMVVFHNRSGGPSHTCRKLAESLIFPFLTFSFSCLFFKNLIETFFHLLVLNCKRSEMRNFFPTACIVTQLAEALHVWVKACKFNTFLGWINRRTQISVCWQTTAERQGVFIWCATASTDQVFFLVPICKVKMCTEPFVTSYVINELKPRAGVWVTGCIPSCMPALLALMWSSWPSL